MNYVLQVRSCDIDKVLLKLLSLGESITIKNVLRKDGRIFVKTALLTEVRSIQEVQHVEKEKRLQQFLVF